MTDNLLFNYISGQASEKEIASVRKWVSESEARKHELSRIKNIWIISGLNNELDSTKKEQAIQQILLHINELNKTQPKILFHQKWIKYVAAIALICILSATTGYFAYKLSSNTYQANYTEFIVPNGERSNVVLPDGSHVQLNSGSTLKFKSSFGSNKRTVSLNGEAYFEITHDKSRPFFVETSKLQVEVLGTKFNVSSYGDDPDITTYLESGKVKINMDGGQNLILRPSEAIRIEKATNKIHKIISNDSRYIDWTNGILTIKGETIEEMSRKLERQFGIEIRFGDDEVKNHTYTGSIKDEELTTVLEALKFTSSLTYKRNANQITLYSRK